MEICPGTVSNLFTYMFMYLVERKDIMNPFILYTLQLLVLVLNVLRNITH